MNNKIIVTKIVSVCRLEATEIKDYVTVQVLCPISTLNSWNFHQRGKYYFSIYDAQGRYS